jgi:N-acetylmuramoyl-L-alanine amidase
VIVATAPACLALNVFHEARSEPIMGQYAVALVTMNRAKKDGERVCAEVFKPKQFSWANNAVMRVKGGWFIPPHLQPREDYAWWVANRVAITTLSGMMADVTRGATHYHTLAVRPAWRLALDVIRDIGAHRFYARSTLARARGSSG